MKTRMRNKTLNILIAAAMAIALIATLSLPANAVTGGIDVGGNYVDDLSTEASGVGWRWSPATNTLSLTATFTGKNIWIDCNPADTINLVYTGDVVINGSAERIIKCDGNLNISGSGGKLTISTGTTGIYTGGSITIRGNADVAIESRGSGIIAGSNVAISGAMVDIKAGGDGITASGNVSINSSSGVIRTGGASDWAVKAGGSITIGANIQVMGYDGANYTIPSVIAAVTGNSTFARASAPDTAMGNIWFAPLANAAITPIESTYDRSIGGDITITLNTGSYTMQGLRVGFNTLIQGKDYTMTAVNNNIYTITLKEYWLRPLLRGTHTVIFVMSNSKDLYFAVTIIETASINPTAATFEINSGKDIVVSLDRANSHLESIRNDRYTLIPDTDYTALGTADVNINTYTIKSSYLNTLEPGSQKITFNMNGGTHPVLTVTVIDPDAPEAASPSDGTDADAEAPEKSAPSEDKDTGATVQESPFPFTDVLESVWYYNDVKNAWQTGLIDGRTPNAFAPDDNLTYAEAIKLAACMHELYTTGSVTLESGNPWYQSYVDYARANGIINKNYNWDVAATRAGYMEIFANALPSEALAVINNISDGAIPDVPTIYPQAAAIYKLYRAGILQGVDPAHNSNPNASIRRSEVAAILTRMMNPAERICFSIS